MINCSFKMIELWFKHKFLAGTHQTPLQVENSSENPSLGPEFVCLSLPDPSMAPMRSCNSNWIADALRHQGTGGPARTFSNGKHLSSCLSGDYNCVMKVTGRQHQQVAAGPAEQQPHRWGRGLWTTPSSREQSWRGRLAGVRLQARGRAKLTVSFNSRGSGKLKSSMQLEIKGEEKRKYMMKENVMGLSPVQTFLCPNQMFSPALETWPSGYFIGT